MGTEQLCDCTKECPGRHLCEIGTWVRPEKPVAFGCASEALDRLGEWLYMKPRSTHKVVAAIFKQTSFVDDPGKIDLFSEFWNAMCALGFEPSTDNILRALWLPPLYGNETLAIPGLDNVKTEQLPIICQPGVSVTSKPHNFQRILEFLVLINRDVLLSEYLRTSEILDLMFPDASKEARNNWFIQAMDDCLYRIGFTPVGIEVDGAEKAGVQDDPEWFCDGDPKDALHFNLWAGADSAHCDLIGKT